MTLATMIGLVREELLSFSTDLVFRDGQTGDPRNTESPVASISITNQINKAFATLAAETRYSVAFTNVAIGSGLNIASLPSTCMDVISVYITNDTRLRKTTMPELDERDPMWRTRTGNPKQYFILGGRYIGVDNSPSSGATLQIACVETPNVLAAGGDTPNYIAEPYQYLAVYLAAMTCASMDAGNDNARARIATIHERYKPLRASFDAMMMDRNQRDDSEVERFTVDRKDEGFRR